MTLRDARPAAFNLFLRVFVLRRRLGSHWFFKVVLEAKGNRLTSRARARSSRRDVTGVGLNGDDP